MTRSQRIYNKTAPSRRRSVSANHRTTRTRPTCDTTSDLQRRLADLKTPGQHRPPKTRRIDTDSDRLLQQWDAKAQAATLSEGTQEAWATNKIENKMNNAEKKTGSLEQRVRALEEGPHLQAQPRPGQDVPREQRTTLVIIGFPKGHVRQDIIEVVETLLNERGLKPKEIYSPFRRSNIVKVKCSDVLQTQRIIVDIREQPQQWLRQ